MKTEVQCLNCSEYKRCVESYWSWFFFLIGIVATVAMRVVTILMAIDQIYGKIAWYIGIVGFLIFFLYQFKISNTRGKIIKKNQIKEKIAQKKELDDNDRYILRNILCSLSSNKEKINYFMIFFTSILALIIEISIEIFK